MTREIKLSYVLTTFNKLNYLKITLPLLINACKSDEEIIITDGGSSDGTANYLKQLHSEGKIHAFISEKDNGEAHGTNKGFLMANGELIKLITDDDVYSFKLIEQCREFMLKHPQTDMIGFDGLGCNISRKKITFEKSKYIEGYKEWLKEGTPFLFCGLSFMFRKSSLAYLGLFNTRFRMIDLEYSLRVSSMKANIAFHTGIGFVAIANPNSNSVKFDGEIEMERKKVQNMYFPKGNRTNYTKIKKQLIHFLAKIKHGMLSGESGTLPFNYNEILTQSVELLKKENATETFEILKP